MNKKLLATLVVVVVAFSGFALLAGNDSSNSSDSSSSTPQISQFSEDINKYLNEAENKGQQDATDQPEVSVDIGDFFYEPTVLTVSKGTTVTWTNQGNIQHNVVSWSGSPNQGLDSELLGNGETYSYTFEETGDYVYFCEPHPFRMRGIVTVVE